MQLTPNSWGTHTLREFNPCHEPGGTAKGGQFCGKDRAVTRVGITTARTPGDPTHFRPNRHVADEMRGLEASLKHLKGVRGVSVKPAVGQWAGGSEFSWAVSYIGNGEARKMLARLGKAWNQDAVLILRHPKPGETPDAATEISFDQPVGGAARTAVANLLDAAGFGGWTWYKRNGRTTLRVVSVPQWGGSPESHRQGLQHVLKALADGGRGHRVRTLKVKTEVYSRDGGDGQQTYDEVLSAAGRPSSTVWHDRK